MDNEYPIKRAGILEEKNESFSLFIKPKKEKKSTSSSCNLFDPKYDSTATVLIDDETEDFFSLMDRLDTQSPNNEGDTFNEQELIDPFTITSINNNIDDTNSLPIYDTNICNLENNQKDINQNKDISIVDTNVFKGLPTFETLMGVNTKIHNTFINTIDVDTTDNTKSVESYDPEDFDHSIEEVRRAMVKPLIIDSQEPRKVPITYDFLNRPSPTKIIYDKTIDCHLNSTLRFDILNDQTSSSELTREQISNLILNQSNTNRYSDDTGDIEIEGKLALAPMNLETLLTYCPPGMVRLMKNFKFNNLSPIQSCAIPQLFGGRHCLGLAETGSGKTLAYCIPLVRHVLGRSPAVCSSHTINIFGTQYEACLPVGLVITPTREIAIQVTDTLMTFTHGLKNSKGEKRIRISPCIADTSKTAFLESVPAEVIVGNIGRIIDSIKGKLLFLDEVTFCVIDEADRMFSPGFSEALQSIIKCFRLRSVQFALFSATLSSTLTSAVSEFMPHVVIINLNKNKANPNIQHEFPSLTKENTDLIQLSWPNTLKINFNTLPFLQYGETEPLVASVLIDWLLILAEDSVTKVLVFVKTRNRAESLTSDLQTLSYLSKYWDFVCLCGSFDGQRRDQAVQKAQKVLIDNPEKNDSNIKEIDDKKLSSENSNNDSNIDNNEKDLNDNKLKSVCLICTDVAARGINIEGVEYVFNYHLPATPIQFIHRVGRTARGLSTGMSITPIDTQCRRQLRFYKQIQRYLATGDLDEHSEFI